MDSATRTAAGRPVFSVPGAPSRMEWCSTEHMQCVQVVIICNTSPALRSTHGERGGPPPAPYRRCLAAAVEASCQVTWPSWLRWGGGGRVAPRLGGRRPAAAHPRPPPDGRPDTPPPPDRSFGASPRVCHARSPHTIPSLSVPPAVGSRRAPAVPTEIPPPGRGRHTAGRTVRAGRASQPRRPPRAPPPVQRRCCCCCGLVLAAWRGGGHGGTALYVLYG